MKELINKFLEVFGRIVTENETGDYVDLMMDNHYCIRWYGKLYYVPKNSLLYSVDDELILEFLEQCRQE